LDRLLRIEKARLRCPKPAALAGWTDCSWNGLVLFLGALALAVFVRVVEA
jgi:hypothetical protein